MTPHSESTTTTSADSTGSGTAQHYSNPESAKHTAYQPCNHDSSAFSTTGRQQYQQSPNPGRARRAATAPSSEATTSEQRQHHHHQHSGAWNPVQRSTALLESRAGQPLASDGSDRSVSADLTPGRAKRAAGRPLRAYTTDSNYRECATPVKFGLQANRANLTDGSAGRENYEAAEWTVARRGRV